MIYKKFLISLGTISMISLGLVVNADDGSDEGDVSCISNETQLVSALESSELDSITLCDDITLTQGIEIERSIVIDGGGHTLNGEISFTGSDTEMEIVIKNITINSQNSAIEISSNTTMGDLTLEDVVLNANKGIYAESLNKLTVKNSTINANHPIYVDHALSGVEIKNNKINITTPGLKRGIVLSNFNSADISGNEFTDEDENLDILFIETKGDDLLDLNSILEANIFPVGAGVINDTSIGIVSIVCVDTKVGLNNAVNNSIIDTIRICGDIEIDNKVVIQRPIVIDGNNHTISGNELVISSGEGYAMVRNLNIKDSENFGLQVYKSARVTLENVTVSNSTKGGILINGSEVVANNITISNNAWGGIELSQGQGVERAPKLTITGKFNFSGQNVSLPMIWIDAKLTNDGWVEGYSKQNLEEKEFIVVNENLENVTSQLWFVKKAAPRITGGGSGGGGNRGGGDNSNANNDIDNDDKDPKDDEIKEDDRLEEEQDEVLDNESENTVDNSIDNDTIDMRSDVVISTSFVGGKALVLSTNVDSIKKPMTIIQNEVFKKLAKKVKFGDMIASELLDAIETYNEFVYRLSSFVENKTKENRAKAKESVKGLQGILK